MTFNGDDDGYFTDELEKQLREGPQVIPPGEGQEMSDLRSACIEAMAEAIWRDQVPEPFQAEHWAVRQGTVALDALLGVLEEHADEVADISIPTDVRGLLAVLREDT